MRHCMLWFCLVGCGSEPEKQDKERTPCEGAGDPLLELGSGGMLNFMPLTEGSAVPFDDGLVEFEFWTAGIRTADPVSAVVRISTTGPTTDSLANVALQCGDAGRGWAAVRAAVPPDAQAGETVTIDASLSDAFDGSIQTSLSVVLTVGS